MIPKLPESRTAPIDPMPPIKPPPQNNAEVRSVSRETVAAGVTNNPTDKTQPTACKDETRANTSRVKIRY